MTTVGDYKRSLKDGQEDKHMHNTKIINTDLPLIPKKSLIRILSALAPRRLTSESTLFDAGYEAAKTDIAKLFEESLNIRLNANTAELLIRQLRKTT